MATKEDLELENQMLRDEVDRFREVNDQLRAQLAEAQQGAAASTRPVPTEPSFGVSEGERQDLELTGRSTSPFTGKVTESASESPADAK